MKFQVVKSFEGPRDTPSVTPLSPEAANMATIRQRGDRWQCIVKRKGYPTQSKSFDLKKDAAKWARQQERLFDTGQWVDRSEAEQTTLKDLLKRYAKEISSTKRGAEVETIRINAMCRTSLAMYAVTAVTGQKLASWRDERLVEVSGSTVTRELQLLGHVFTVAIREWGFGLHSNPVSLIRKPTPNKARGRVLNDTQRQALIAACAQCQSPWITPVVVFALETAARRGEILALTWHDVDLERKVAKASGKTGGRTIPLSPACVSMLRSLPRSLEGHVFPVTIETLKQAYARAVARAGIQDFTFHDLRHDALTRLAKLGLNILELRSISGHTTANMLQRYVSIDAGELAVKLAHAS
ncbi:MAG: tyrosine-type recombinase/integrase [Thiobacillus sp.]